MERIPGIGYQLTATPEVAFHASPSGGGQKVGVASRYQIW